MSEVLSANYPEGSMKENTHKCIRKVIIDGNDNNLVDELVEDLSDSVYSNDQRHEKHEPKNSVSRGRHRLATFSLRSVIDGGVQSKFNITCLLCKRRFAYNDARSTFLAYYICDDCMESEKGHAEELEAALVNNDKARPVSISCTGEDLDAYDHCKCQNCVRRQLMNEERRKETEVLQRCWHDLRQNIRQMFRDGLNANMTSSKGKRFDVDKIKRNVTILAEKDPHQLYKRLESIGHEYVMNLKSDDLWQILVAPQVVPALIQVSLALWSFRLRESITPRLQLYEAGASEEQMELERAKLFIKTLLDRFSCQQETAKNMSSLLAVLDEGYLSQFGISWKVVNHHIFDRVIYQDDLLLNYLPSLENALKCKLIVHDDENEEDRRQRACTEVNRTDIPQGALELAQSFRVFHKLMVTSREIFKKASANIVLYSEQQKVINHIKRKTKGELLDEDLEFFKSQRKMVHNCILRKDQYYQWHADLTAVGNLTDLIDDGCDVSMCESYHFSDNSDSEADDVNLSKRLHELIEEGPPTSVCIDENGEVLPCVRCKRCTLRYCSCDECRISHIITCGLLIDNEDISNLIWPVSDCYDRSDDKDSDSEQSQQKKSSLPNIKRLPNRNLRFQTARALFTVHDHHSVPKKETAWGDWQVPYSYSNDIDCLSHCLCERKGMHSDFGSLNNRQYMVGLLENEIRHIAALQIQIFDLLFNLYDGEEEYTIDRIDSPGLPNSNKHQEIVKEAFELMTKGHRVESSSNCEFESNDVPGTLSVIGDEKKTSVIGGSDNKHGVKNSFLVRKSNLCSEEKSGFTISSVSNINVKRFKIKKAGNNVARDSDGAESDYETPSASFPGSNECMDSCHLSGPDRLLLKEMTRRHYAVLTKDNAVSDLALELFGRKTMEKPQMVRKAGLTPPVSRLIRKSKLVSDKNDANSGSISAVKSLSASARERLLSEVKSMDKKVRERNLLRLVQSYEDERWTTRSEDYKSRLIESMKECLSKDWAKEDETNDLKIIIKDEKYGSLVICFRGFTDLYFSYGSTRKTVNQNSTAKTSHQEKKNDREMIYIPEARTMVSFATTSPSSSANKKAKSSPRKVEQDDLAQLWSKQTLAAAIAKQLTDQRTIMDISKAFNVEKQKTAQTVSCKMGNHLDAMSNSTTAIDFSVNLGEFDINNVPEELRRLHEEKLKKLLKQAVGLKQNKTSMSTKVDCKYDDGKRIKSDFGDSKEELFGYQTDNFDDLTDDDDEGTDEEWSDCEAPDEQHPYRHHSCDNKANFSCITKIVFQHYFQAKNKRTASGTGRDGRHGHCDCCYCEMFGHSVTESIKSGRAQIRERLRMKLKRRSVQEHSGTDAKNQGEKLTYAATNQESKKSLAVVPDAPIEEILDYINEKDIVAAQAAASKAAKRARQKLRKQEEKERQERERKLKEEQKKAVEAELLKKKKEQQAAQEVRKEKQSKPEAKKKKMDRVRGRKQKDGRDRKKEIGLQLSESQEVEVRKEPVLEFEYWNDPKCDPKFKQLGSTKEQSGTSKIGRMRAQNKEESKKSEDIPKRSELEKRESEKENASSKREGIRADSVVNKNDNKSSENESNGFISETTFPIHCVTKFLKTENCESQEADLDIQPTMKLPSDKESDVPSTDVTVSEASTVLSEVELVSQPPELKCSITELLPPKMPPLLQSLSEISVMLPAGLNNANITQRLPFPILQVPPPSQANTLGFGTYQGGVGYYTHFGGQPQVYLINGLNQCVVSSSNQNAPLLSSESADFAQESVLRPLRTSQGFEARTCQIGINDTLHISGQYSVPSSVNTPSTDMLQRTGPVSPIPVFDTKSFQTTTNFSSFDFQKLPLYVSEPSSLSPLSSSASSSSLKPSLYGPPFSLRDFDFVSFKGTKTAEMPSLGVMSLPLQNDLCHNNGTAQIFLDTSTAANGFTLPDSACCPKQYIPDIAIPVGNMISDNLPVPTQDLLYCTSLEQDIIAAKIQKSSPCMNAQFLVTHQNDSTMGNISNAAQLNKVETDGALLGSSQFTAAIRSKRSEACKTFLSSSSPLADYDSETRKLAAFAKEDEIFRNQNPMIFEPGDPRIAVAIAEMKFDPHEAFKPRPNSELEFLDPLELEVEHFKRVLWEEEQLTRPRVPLRELRKIDPENEPDAVFHFAPLV
ncbi:unnamed protein product [Onchocerca flexuosa]|uniref:ATP-dependent DNA helicase n=1 Tax=Onchocerca flexuosa TaxID=387005 RepID=A0A183HYP9_9BILA|nr:unnamed protein product [Onchocerca flexuosa]